jgi:hypothetical protein
MIPLTVPPYAVAVTVSRISKALIFILRTRRLAPVASRT